MAKIKKILFKIAFRGFKRQLMNVYLGE